MKKLIILSFVCLFSQTKIFAQDWLWGTSISGNDLLESEALGIDSSNNIYLLNELNGSSVVQGYTTNTFGNKDLQISKFSISGAIQWTRGIGGVGTDDPKDLFTDVSGNSYITGSFEGTTMFSTQSINAQNGKDAFLAKYDAFGNVVWAKDIAWGESDEKGVNVSVNSIGDITIAGFFKDTIIFGDTVGAANSDTLIAQKVNKNYFIAKFDNNGNYIFSKLISASNKNIAMNYLSLYNGVNYYLGGYYTDSLFVGNDTLVARQGSRDIAVINFDVSGNVIWTKSFGDNNLDELNGIESDESNNIYITGAFQDSLMFDNDTIYGLSDATYDLYVAKLDPNGNVLWAFSEGDTQNDYGWSVTYRNGNLQVSGSFSGTIIWGGDTISTSGMTDLDAFFAALEVNTGNLIALKKVIPGGPLVANDEPRDIVVDNFGNTYMAGRYASDYLYFGNDTIANANPGQYDVFLAKFGCQEVYLNFAVDSVTCPGMFDGGATVTPTIPNPYIYLWSSGDTTNSISSVTNGLYTVTLSTPWGCEYNDTVNIDHYTSLTTYMNSDTITLNCVAGTDGIAIVTPVNGVDSGYTYSWDTGILDSMVTNLDTGLHFVTVSDYCGSVIDTVFATYLPTLVETTYPHAIILLCENSSDGEATVNASLGYPAYHYIWDNGDTTATTYSLDVGIHYVTVYDGCNVQQIDSVKVNYLPPMHMNITDTQAASCPTYNDGQAYADAISGVPPYTYLWDNGDTTSSTMTLDTGYVYVTVTDYCGSIVDSAYITFKPQLSVTTASVQDADCPTSTNGAALVSTTNGIQPFTYAWSNSSDVDSLASDLPVGINYVSVTDQCGMVVDSVNITNKTPLSITVSELQVATCPSDSDGVAMVYPSDGVEPFTYAWSNSSDIDSLASDLLVGVNYVSVTDQCGTVIDSVTISNLPQLSISVSELQVVSCPTGSDGSAIVTTTDGVAPFTYAWSTSTDTDSLASDLPIGYTYVSVTDQCGVVVDSISLSNSPVLNTSVTYTDIKCYGDSTGQIVATPALGVPPYSYTWSNDGSLQDSIANDLSVGTYHLTVSDYCGQQTFTVDLTQGDEIVFSADITNATTNLSTDGEIDLSVQGGVSPYSFIWSNDEITEDLTDLMYGTYRVTVTDMNDCQAIDVVKVEAESYGLIIYNSFSPNEDGVNDLWNIKNIGYYPNCKVQIFNEWGNLVFSSDGYEQPWDGNSNGTALPAATYYYIIDLGDGSKPLSGPVTIIK